MTDKGSGRRAAVGEANGSRFGRDARIEGLPPVDPVPVVRAVLGYDKNTNRLVVELPLRPVSLAFLYELAGEPAHAPLLYGCYQIDEARAAALRPFVAGSIDLTAFDYFLECYWTPNRA
jgi:hypothetical protein